MEGELVCALLLGEAETREKAEQIAKRYKNCPYISFMAIRENQLFAAFFLPRRQRWWIEYVEKKPKETFRLERAKVTVVDHVYYPEQLKMRLPNEPLEVSPCGTNCGTCPAYQKCLGCPATLFYKHRKHDAS